MTIRTQRATAPFRDPSDQQLLERFRAQRDEAAFAEIVARYGGTVWNVCRRVLVQRQEIEDAFQAVFLILARKADRIRKGEALGSWLYGVAYRTAVRARQRASQCKARDEQAPCPGPAPAAWTEAACRELHRLLDEEVGRLPEHYRAPFVLCCLHGMSRAEAACELGWNEGTLSTRLARARARLQKRLLLRGVTLSAALTAMVLAQAGAAAVPAALLATTGSALAPAGAGQISPAAVALAEALLPSTGSIKLSTLLAPAILLLLVAAVSVAVLHPGTPGRQTQPSPGPGPTVPRLLVGHTGPVHNLVFAPDGRLVSAGGWPDGDRTLRLWDADTGHALGRFDAPAQIQALDLSGDGRLALLGLNDGNILCVDIDRQRLVRSLHGHAGTVSWLTFLADGRHAISTAIDGTARLWDLSTGRERRRFQALSKWVRAGAVSPDGRRLAIGHNHGIVQIWDVAAAQEIGRIERRCGWINWLAFTPDGRQLLIADREAALHDLDTGALVREFAGHGDEVQQLTLAPDNRVLLTACYDGAVRLWDFSSGKLLRRLSSHDGLVFSVACAPAGRHVAAGGGGQKDERGYRAGADNAIRLWDLTALLAGRR